MADLKHLRMKIDVFGQKPLFRCDTCIAREQHAKRAILQDERDRIVVDRVLSTDERQRRADKRQREAIVGMPHVARARKHDGYAIRGCGVETIVIRMSAVRLPAVGDFVDANLVEHRPAPTNMVT